MKAENMLVTPQKTEDSVSRLFDNNVYYLLVYPDTKAGKFYSSKTHKPKNDAWARRHPNVHFHYTPTHASWLNQIECWFSILTRSALRGVSFTSPAEVCVAIDKFITVYNQTAPPFEWTKSAVHPVGFKKYYANLCK